MSKNIILIGFKAAGKSTIGKLLSNTLSYDLIDTDQEILKLNQNNKFATIGELYNNIGEAEFRKQEYEVTQLLPELITNSTVIATGGGVVLNPDNIKLLQDIGTIIYLNTPEEIINQRVNADQSSVIFKNNTNMQNEKLSKAYSQRKDLYARYADYIINTCDKTADKIVTEIKKIIDGA